MPYNPYKTPLTNYDLRLLILTQQQCRVSLNHLLVIIHFRANMANLFNQKITTHTKKSIMNKEIKN